MVSWPSEVCHWKHHRQKHHHGRAVGRAMLREHCQKHNQFSAEDGQRCTKHLAVISLKALGYVSLKREREWSKAGEYKCPSLTKVLTTAVT